MTTDHAPRSAAEVSSTTDTIPVRETHRFDVAALERYMAAHVGGFKGPVAVTQFQGGQSNPTYRLSSPGGEYVLRRKPPGKLLPSAHAVDREYRIMTALAPTRVPVPRTYALCEDDTVIGTAFFIMEWVRGRVVADPLLPGMSPADRGRVYVYLGQHRQLVCGGLPKSGGGASRILVDARAALHWLLYTVLPSREPAARNRFSNRDVWQAGISRRPGWRGQL